MFKKSKPKKTLSEEEVHPKVSNSEDLFLSFSQSDDFINYEGSMNEQIYRVSFYQSLIDGEALHENVLSVFSSVQPLTLKNIEEQIPIENPLITRSPDEIKDLLMRGGVAIRLASELDECLVINIPVNPGRQVTAPEQEYGIIGAFVENYDVNLNLIRQRLPVPELKVTELTVGSLSKTKIGVLYIDDIANPENVATVIQRIKDIEFEFIRP